MPHDNMPQLTIMDQQTQVDAISQTADREKKKAYRSPTLSEYGNIATATQNMVSGIKADANGMLMGM